MNFRKIFLIGMLVLILSVSAVSAADENVTQGLSPDDSQDLQMTEEDTVEEGINQLDLDFNVPDKILYQEQCDFSYNYSFSAGGGSVDVYFNDEKVGSNPLVSGAYGRFSTPIYPMKMGENVVSYKFAGNDFYAPFEKTFKYNVDDWKLNFQDELTLADDYNYLNIYFPADGKADISMDSKKFSYDIQGGYSIDVPYNGFALGRHNVTVKFTSNDNKFKSKTCSKMVTIYPGISYFGYVGYKSGEGVEIFAPEGASGTFAVKIDGNDYRTVNIKDTRFIPLDSFALGDHRFSAEYVSGDFKHEYVDRFKVTPFANVSNYYFKGKDNSMSVTLPDDVSGNLSVKLNDEEIYSNGNASGFITIPLDKLTEDNYIEVIYNDGSFESQLAFNPKLTSNNPVWQMNITAPEKVFINADQIEIVIALPPQYGGNMELLIDGKDKGVKGCFWYEDCVKYEITLSQLNEGIHKIQVMAFGDDFYIPINKTFNMESKKVFVDYPDPLNSPENDIITLQTPTNEGTAKFYIDGKLMETLKDEYFTYCMIPHPYGEHTFKVVYDGKYGHFEESKKIYYDYAMFPLFKSWLFPDKFYYGNENYLIYYTVYEFTRTLTIEIDGKTYKSKGENGFVNFDISNIKAGNYTVKVSYEGDKVFPKKTFTHDLEILPRPLIIQASALSMFYNDGTYYTVKILDNDGNPMKGAEVNFDIGGGRYASAKTYSNGIAKVKITEKPGSYKVTASCNGAVSTKKVTVKHVVSLKSVTVKRSAKKLILQATLKDRKVIKNKQVTFKFNGKTYKAKTNSKGIAKVTIKSSVLKKLKVGKKVTYQATYMKDTVKKTVKVSR